MSPREDVEEIARRAYRAMQVHGVTPAGARTHIEAALLEYGERVRAEALEQAEKAAWLASHDQRPAAAIRALASQPEPLGWCVGHLGPPSNTAEPHPKRDLFPLEARGQMSQPESTERCEPACAGPCMAVDGVGLVHAPACPRSPPNLVVWYRRALAEAEARALRVFDAHEREMHGYLDRLAEAEKERDGWRRKYEEERSVTWAQSDDALRTALRAAEERAASAERDRDEARRLFALYSGHWSGCPRSPGGHGSCTCGLFDAEAALGRAEPAAGAPDPNQLHLPEVE